MTENPLLPFLEAQGFLVLDGGLATALEHRGHVLDSHLWSARLLLDEPDAIADAHRSFLEAGADCITTASYQASFEGLRAAGLDRTESERVLRRSTRIATAARDAHWSTAGGDPGRLRPIVAASVGPYGAYLADGSEYDGRYGVDADQLRAFHLRRFEVLADTQPDVVACETIPSALEARVLLSILDDVPGVWAWFSFSCREGGRLNDGSPIMDVARACSTHERVAGVGVNCTDPGFVSGLLAAVRAGCDLPLIAYPNSGGSYDAETKTWSGDTSPTGWVASVDEWVDAGARVVGGCCRVGPDMIRDVRDRMPRGFGRASEPAQRPRTGPLTPGGG